MTTKEYIEKFLKIKTKDILEKIVPFSEHRVTIVDLAWEVED